MINIGSAWAKIAGTEKHILAGDGKGYNREWKLASFFQDSRLVCFPNCREIVIKLVWECQQS